MKFRGIIAGALALVLSASVAFGQTNPGASPLTGAKGGTNNAFMQFSGPATSIKTFTLPNASGTIDLLNAAQTFTAAKTFNDLTLLLAGSSSGTTTLKASATASGTLTLPAATDTLIGKATTDTLTNKTFDTAGTGNSFSIAGVAVTANNGTGAVARTTSPVFVTPVLGAASATSLNGNFFTAGTYTLAGGAGKTFSFSNTLTVAGTDGTTLTFQGTDTYIGRTTTDTLTNKTLTSPVMTAPVLGVATATTINKVTITAPASAATLTIPDGVTLTGPAASGTAMTLGNTETITGVKTFGSSGAVGRFKLAGTTSGTTTLDASATASGTLTLPAATDTLVGKATTDTLTNKTFDTAGTGNSFSIAGVPVTANNGTGAVARTTSPVFVTPTLGVAAATSINGNFFTAGTYTLAGAASKTFTFNNTLTFAGTDSTTITFQGSDTYVGRTTTDTLTNKTLTSPAISAPTVTGVEDNQGTLKLSSFVTSTQITTSQNDYTATDGSNTCATKTTLKISSNGSVNITGLSCSQAEGDLRIVHNVGSQTVTLKNSDVGSLAANRLLLASDVSLPADYSITLRYDGVALRWRPLTTPGSGGGGGGTVTIAAGAGISVSGTCNGSTGTCTVANTFTGMPDVIVEEQQTSGTNAGGSTSGSFATRSLNTLVRNNGTLAVIGSGQVQLPAGTYYITWSAPALASNLHATRLQNITDATTVAMGTAEFSDAGVATATRSVGSIVVTIAGSKSFAVQHRVSGTHATNGLGAATGFGTEVYTRMEITKMP